jgi:hypothetical protein
LTRFTGANQDRTTGRHVENQSPWTYAVVAPDLPHHPCVSDERTTRRGETKRRRITRWLLRWHFSSASILLRIAGLDPLRNRCSIGRWLKSGILRRTSVFRAGSGSVYILTPKALHLAERDADRRLDPEFDEAYLYDLITYYQTSVNRLSLGYADHALLEQEAVLERLPEIHGYVTDRLMHKVLLTEFVRETSQLRKKLKQLEVAIDDLDRCERVEAIRAWHDQQASGYPIKAYEPLLRRWEAEIKSALADGTLDDPLHEIDRLAEEREVLNDTLWKRRECVKKGRAFVKRPDAVLFYPDGQRVALEIERAKKRFSELKKGLDDHITMMKGGVYHSVLYLCANEKIVRDLDDAFEILNADDQEAFSKQFEFRVIEKSNGR